MKNIIASITLLFCAAAYGNTIYVQQPNYPQQRREGGNVYAPVTVVVQQQQPAPIYPYYGGYYGYGYGVPYYGGYGPYWGGGWYGGWGCYRGWW